MIRSLALTALAALLLMPLSGCGQKGPLKLPEPEQVPASQLSESESK